MTKRQISIRVALDGAADVKRDQQAIAAGGEEAGRRIAAGFEAATAAVGKYDAAGRRAVATHPKRDLPGGTYGAPYQGFDTERAAADILARQKDFQTKIFGAVRAGAGPVDLGAALQARSARDANSVFAVNQKADAARAAQIAQWQREQAGQNFRDEFERRMGLTSRPASESGATVSAFQEQAREMEAMQARADALLAQIDPLAAAQSRLAKETAEYNRMLEHGVLSEGQHASAMAASQKQYDQAVLTAARMSRGVALSSFQMTNLTYQMNDVISGLAMGQRPLSVMLQQGGQIYQVFAGTGMGVTGALKAVGASLAGLLSPTALVAGGIATLAGSVGYLEYAGVKTGKALDAALTGTGRAAGVTASQLNDMALRASGQAQESVSTTRGWSETYAKTGKIHGKQIGDLTAITADYAATTGESQDDAVKELAASFGDLSKGIDTLDAKTGAFDVASKEAIKNLMAEGQYTEAFRLAMEKLKPTLADHIEQMSALERFWHAMGVSVSNGIDSFKSSPTNGDQIKRLEESRRYLQNSLNSGNPLTKNITQAQIAGVDAQLQQLHAQEDTRIKQSQRGASDALSKTRAEAAKPILLAIVPAVQESEFRKNLGSEHFRLRQLLKDPEALKHSGYSREKVLSGLNITEYENRTHLSDADRSRQSAQIEVDAAKAQTPEQKADIAARRERLALAGQQISSQDAETRIQSAYNAVLQTGNYEMGQQNRLLSANVTQTALVADAWLKSGAAAMDAAARRQAISDNIQNGISMSDRWHQIMGQSISGQAENTAQSAARLRVDADARKQVYDAVVAGSLAYANANSEIQKSLDLSDLQAARADALKYRMGGLVGVIDRVTKSYSDYADIDQKQSRRGTALQLIGDQRTQIRMTSAQLFGIQTGMTPDQLSDLKLLGDENDLLDKGLAIRRSGNLQLTEEGTLYVANARYINNLNRELELTKSANDSVYQFQAGIFDRLDDQISGAKSSWSDYFEYILSSFSRTAMELTAINPLKNMLLGGDANGQQLPTMNNIGGLLGQWMGNGAGDAVQDVSVTGRRGNLVDMATHGLSPTLSSAYSGAVKPSLSALCREMFSSGAISDVAITGQRGNLVDMPDNNFSSSGTGSLMSSAAMWIASLFHDGGDVYSAANSTRTLPASVISAAPRFHTGVDLGLKPDEVPAILQTGERVLNRQEAADARKGRGGAASSPTINIHNNGEAVSVSNASYDKGSNTLDVSLERQAVGMVRAGVRGGAFDMAMNDRFGMRPLTTRR